LRGYDQLINLILDDCHERIYSTQQALERQALGLYLIRGENVAIVGELDIDKEADMDITQKRGEQLKPVIH
jgi:U6 snRNA-associated Sm-like protein LSm8